MRFRADLARTDVSGRLPAWLAAGVVAWVLVTGRPAIHAQSVVTTIPVGDSPWGVAVNPITNRIYVANNASHDVSVIAGDTSSVVATVAVDRSTSVVAVDPETNRIYVANCNIPSRGACVIDGATNGVVASLGVTVYRDMAVNPQTNRLYAHTIAGQDDRVTVIDGNTLSVLAHVPLGTSAQFEDVAIAVNPATNRVYVTYSGTNALVVVDGGSHTILTTIPLGEETDDVAVNPATDRIYAIYGNNVAVIDGTNHAIVDTISDLGVIDDLVVNPQTNRIYVNGLSKVRILDGATNGLAATVAGLPAIWDLAVNPDTGRLYTTHASDDIVSVIEDVAGPSPPTATPTMTRQPAGTVTPTPTLSWTPDTWVYVPLLLKNQEARADGAVRTHQGRP